METLAELNGKLFAQGAQTGREFSFGSNSARARSAAGRSHNVFPDLPGLREAVQDYLTALTGLGHKLMTTFARGLGLQDSYFVDRYTGNPDTLLRVIAHAPRATRRLGGTGPEAGELLTLVRPDEAGGLCVLYGGHRLEVKPEPGALLCEVGPGLMRVSGGRYLAAQHSLRSTLARRQFSLVFSFDPGSAELMEPSETERLARAPSAHVAHVHAGSLVQSA
jgi:isopenicillin N synthase-like dioxygenase